KCLDHSLSVRRVYVTARTYCAPRRPSARKRIMRTVFILSLVAPLMLLGCATAPRHASDVQGQADQSLTVGTVQKEIRAGMTGADVAQALGSPNIVSTDEKRREVWVYDKVATDSVHSSSSGWVFAILAG